MPKKPTDSLQGFRIELQDSERELLQHFATSYRIRAITGDDGVLDDFSDMGKVLSLLGVLGWLLELFGITDIFDFDAEIKAQVIEAGDNIKDNAKKGEYNDTLLNYLKTTPFGVPFVASDFITQNLQDQFRRETLNEQ